MRSNLLVTLLLLTTTMAATAQRPPRPIELGSSIKALRFEHGFGAGVPAAANIDMPQLRGRVVVLEFWGTT